MIPAAEAVAKRAGVPLVAFPSRERPLFDALAQMPARVVVCDLVWQTAPTPELARAFAPPPGREKVRPIEGYEMQLEHAGFDVVERVDLQRDDWIDAFPAQRDAVLADARGAAKVAVWLLTRID